MGLDKRRLSGCGKCQSLDFGECVILKPRRGPWSKNRKNNRSTAVSYLRNSRFDGVTIVVELDDEESKGCIYTMAGGGGSHNKRVLLLLPFLSFK